ncbi:hypothetical protein [Pararobbsia silviterrae]|uniref:hypothetical protein n=1 Tax=Pararobbsia silviterrae TaxID=1792498 RepID=UPI00197D7F57|nr:hypothetical protein [Pararobbsia silviterrae]
MTFLLRKQIALMLALILLAEKFTPRLIENQLRAKPLDGVACQQKFSEQLHNGR